MPWKNLLLRGFLGIEYVVEDCSKMFFVNLLVRWPWNFGYFFSIILHTVCAFFPNAGEPGSSYSLIIVSLIGFSNDFLIAFF